MDSRARMMLDALNLPSALQQSQQPAQPMRYAEGGMVGLPSLADLARPDFDWSSLNSFAPAPSSFTPMTQNVPLFVAQSPAYGNMGTDVYDWKAPTATAAPRPYSTVNQPVAQTVDVRPPTATATVNVPMPGVSTPMPNVPGAGDAATIAPSPVPVATPATPVVNPLGPDPFELRQSEAAAELEAFNQRQAEEAARMAEAKRVADAAAAAEAARQAEAKRVADAAAAAEAARRDYMLANPDVAKAYAKGEYGAMTPQEAAQFHYYRYGINEGRVAPSNVLMDYMSANSDVAKDYAKGQFGDMTPQEAAQFHYYNYGINEGRAPPGPAPAAAPAAPQQAAAPAPEPASEPEPDNSWYNGDGG